MSISIVYTLLNHQQEQLKHDPAFQSMYLMHSKCDTRIVVEDCVIHAHKDVLSEHSPQFRVVFDGKQEEPTIASKHRPPHEILLVNEDAQIMNFMIELFYSGQVSIPETVDKVKGEAIREALTRYGVNFLAMNKSDIVERGQKRHFDVMEQEVGPKRSTPKNSRFSASLNSSTDGFFDDAQFDNEEFDNTVDVFNTAMKSSGISSIQYKKRKHSPRKPASPAIRMRKPVNITPKCDKIKSFQPSAGRKRIMFSPDDEDEERSPMKKLKRTPRALAKIATGSLTPVAYRLRRSVMQYKKSSGKKPRLV